MSLFHPQKLQATPSPFYAAAPPHPSPNKTPQSPSKSAPSTSHARTSRRNLYPPLNPRRDTPAPIPDRTTDQNASASSALPAPWSAHHRDPASPGSPAPHPPRGPRSCTPRNPASHHLSSAAQGAPWASHSTASPPRDNRPQSLRCTR